MHSKTKHKMYCINSKMIGGRSFLRTLLAFSIAAGVVSLTACGKADNNVSPRPREVIGNLGGAPVKIPIEFAESVEYDGDPAVLEPWLKPVPKRTSESKLRSFGFEFRYPDMIGPGSEEARKDRASHFPGNTFWIFVGLHSGEDYRGAGFAERLSSAELGRPEAITKAFYRLTEKNICGLESYVLAGNDSNGKPNREHSNARDLFLARGADGKVTSFIKCSNRPLNAAPCDQYFDLEPDMRAAVYLGYRRGLLCEWRGIQNAASQILSSFALPRETN